MRMLRIDDISNSSSEGDFDNPIAAIKIERIEQKAMQKYEKNKRALKNWQELRMKLMTYMIFMTEYKQRRGIGMETSSYLSLK